MAGIFRVFRWIEVLFVFAVPFAVLVEAEGKPGDEKRAEVVKMLKEEIDKLGLSFPKWLTDFLTPLLGLIVDVVVTILNRTGFFEGSDG